MLKRPEHSTVGNLNASSTTDVLDVRKILFFFFNVSCTTYIALFPFNQHRLKKNWSILYHLILTICQDRNWALISLLPVRSVFSFCCQRCTYVHMAVKLRILCLHKSVFPIQQKWKEQTLYFAEPLTSHCSFHYTTMCNTFSMIMLRLLHTIMHFMCYTICFPLYMSCHKLTLSVRCMKDISAGAVPLHSSV